MTLRLTSYTLKKILSVIPTLLGLSLLIFYTSTFFPINQRAALFVSPLSMAGSGAPSSFNLAEKYALNDPFYIQFTRWLGVLLTGSLGWSYRYNALVTEVISRAFPVTAELIMYAVPIIIILGYKLGVFSAKRAHSKAPHEDPADLTIRILTTIGYSIPSFALGLLLLTIFFVGFGWVGISRVGSAASSFIASDQWTHYTRLYTIDALLNGQLWIFFDAAMHLVLPVITLTTQNLAIVVRITRTSVIGELLKPHIVAARAKGLNEKAIIRHAKRPALSSVLTISGILFASMLTGVIVTEYIFSMKGIGFLVLQAAERLDYTLLIGASLLFCVVFMLVNLIVDLAYAFIDPRVES